MALSQLQCLDDNHVNPRTHESKPEFLYCEDQRLALEALMRDGREAFVKYLGARGLRGFLSDPELETLAGAVEPYDPGSDLFPENAEDDETPLSQHYWPELSDTSIPQMDLGWPDGVTYRGVTRTTVYTQPPLEGQVHIKEVVRKMIAQAQKVIAVVMDVFTDVDIFRDLLDAGFKRKVSVYILLERTTLPHFRSMCQRANMHAGHLKQLRVRCTDGLEFHTRSCTKVRGRMGHRFMFIDGDKAVSGSYSFTWMSSRLDKNLITVVTGQAVEAFDRLFRVLYATSSSTNLRQVATDPEPELEPLPQPAPVAPPSAAIARKLYSPKYALVALSNPSPALSGGPKETQNSEKQETKKQRGASKEAAQEAPPIHPGLFNLEKACMISYLPTWPEPDPPSDVIGFINIRDARKANQVHLQRSELFETSQAIRFSSPFSMPEETLPKVAKPRQLTVKPEEMNKPQQGQEKTKAEELVVGRDQPTQLKTGPGDIKSKVETHGQTSPASGSKLESDKDPTKTLNTENKQHSNSPTKQDAHTLRQSSSEKSTPNTGAPSHTTPTVTSLPGPNTKKEAETNLNVQRDVVCKTHAPESSSMQDPHLPPPADCNSNAQLRTQTKTGPPHTDSPTQAVHAQPQNSSEITPNTQTPTVNSHTSSSSTSARSSHSISPTSLSENVSVTTSTTTNACSPLSSTSSPSSIPHLTSSSTTPGPPLLSSPSLTPTPPVPKPRTVQLVIKDGVAHDGPKLPEFSVVRTPETSTGSPAVHNEPAVATVVPTKKVSVPELQNNSGSNKGAQKDAESTLNIGEAQQQKQSGASQETKNEEADGRHERAGMQSATGNKAKSDVLIADVPKAEGMNIQEIIPKDVEPKTSTSIDCKLTPQCAATVRTEIKAPDRAVTSSEVVQVPNEKSEKVTERKAYLARAHVPQRISYSELTPKDLGVLDTVDFLQAPTQTPVSATHMPKDSTRDGTHASASDTQGRQGNPSFAPAHGTDGMPNTVKRNTHGTFQQQTLKTRGSTRTPERPLHLHLSDKHTPDLHSPTPERELRSLSSLTRTPTPDGFLPRTPTPDSRTHSPDPRSYTPDFRTPTSDGYITPRAGSALSTTSEEFYECSGSPPHEPVFERASSCNNETTEDHVSFTNTPNATSITTGPAYISSNTHAATLGSTDRNTSSSETQSLSGPASVSSSSSLLEKKVEMAEEGETTNEENGREEDEKGKTVSMEERTTEGTEKRGSEEAKRTAEHFKQGTELTETEGINKEAKPQALKRKKVLNQSRAERSVDGVTPGGLTNERAEPKTKRPDKETIGQKLLHTPPKTPRLVQQDRAYSPSRPSRPPRPLSGNQPGPRHGGNRQLNQAESKGLPGSFQALDNISSPRRAPSRPPPPVTAGAVGSAAGRKQAGVLHSQQSLISRQPPATQGRTTRAGQNQHPYQKSQAPYLHSHSNREAQLPPHSQNQTVSPREAHWQEEGRAPFSFTFSKLYSLKGLKDKMSKLPTQSKRGSASSPVQGRKSTS